MAIAIPVSRLQNRTHSLIADAFKQSRHLRAQILAFEVARKTKGGLPVGTRPNPGEFLGLALTYLNIIRLLRGCRRRSRGVRPLLRRYDGERLDNGRNRPG